MRASQGVNVAAVLLLLQSSQPGSAIIGVAPLLAMLAIFYFLLIMPMQKQKKQTQRMLAGLKNGDVVTTSGGVIGSVVALNQDDTLVIRVKPDNVKLLVARSSVSSVAGEDTK